MQYNVVKVKCPGNMKTFLFKLEDFHTLTTVLMVTRVIHSKNIVSGLKEILMFLYLKGLVERIDSLFLLGDFFPISLVNQRKDFH